MKRAPKNAAASVRAKLLNIAEKTGEDYNLLLVRYVAERLLYRLGVSEHSSAFVLKGAMLFLVWGNHPHRPTRDIDLLGYGESTPAHLVEVFRSLCTLPVSDDGVLFLEDSVAATAIRALDEYGGIRVTLQATIGTAVIAMQVDVGYGDATTPSPTETDYPTILEMPVPRLRVYAKETVVAEKTEAIVKLSMANTRYKDYFDLRELSASQSFDGPLLSQALRATFERRRTTIPATVPVGLTATFGADTIKEQQWRAFCNKSSVVAPVPTLASVVASIAAFVGPPLIAASTDTSFMKRWDPSGSWE
jgi:hypothetical protein